MKKLISLFLSLVMVMSAVISVDFSAFANTNSIDTFTLTPAKPYEVIVNTDGYYDFQENMWRYLAPRFNYGDVITVQYKDGSTDDFVYSSGTFCNEADKELRVNKYNFCFNGTGETTFEVSLIDYNKSIDVPVTVIENPVASFTLTPAKPYEIIVNTNGYYDDDLKYWYYHSPKWNEGDVITVNFSDDRIETYTCDGKRFYNSENELLDVKNYGFYYNGTGNTTFEVKLYDYELSINVPVTIIENPVEFFTLTPAQPYKLIKNTNGYYEESEDAWHYYAPEWNKGDVITIKYTDGSTDNYVCNGWDFCNSSSERLYCEKYDFIFNGTGETTFEVRLKEYNKSYNTPITVEENPVASFELTPIKPYEIIVNTNGFYDDSQEAWCYNAPNYNEGDIITVNYTDGRIVNYTCDGWYFRDSIGQKLNVNEDFFAYDGTGSTTFKVELEDYNVSIDVPVTIIENPVSSFTLTPVTPYEMIIDIGFYDKYEDVWYFDYPDWNKGDVITVNYSNGTKDDFICDGYEFYNSNEELIQVRKYGFETKGLGETTFEILLSDYNKKIDFPVTVIENPISSFELTPVNPYEYAVNTNGYYDESENSWYYYGPYWNEGDVITINYSNGTTDDFVYNGWDFVNSKDECLRVYSYGFYFDGTGETTFELKLYDYNKTIKYPISIVSAHVHSYSKDVIPPSCISNGYTVFTCDCGHSYIGDYVKPTGHKYDTGKVTKAATCKSTGVKICTCTVCDEKRTVTIAKTNHNYKNYVTKATLTANGKIVNKCSVCGVVKSTTAVPLVKKITISATNYNYDGRVKTPAVTVKDSKGKTLKKNTDYTVSYAKGRKNVGKYAVKITLKGNYYCTKTLYFNINPKGTKIAKLTPKSKSLTVQWNKQTNQTTGYQIQYSTSSKFSKAKTITVGKNTYYAKSITGLAGNKRYYVRVRTYKTVKFNGKNYNLYSPWSSAKYTTTKR